MLQHRLIHPHSTIGKTHQLDKTPNGIESEPANYINKYTYSSLMKINVYTDKPHVRDITFCMT